jgi:cell division GTPase FtsZ
MRRLFNEHNTYTNEGTQLSRDIDIAIMGVIRKLDLDNIDLRDVENIVQSTAHIVMAEVVISHALEKRSKKRKEEALSKSMLSPTAADTAERGVV